MWKTPNNETLQPGKPFVLPQTVEVKKYGWEEFGTGKFYQVQAKDADGNLLVNGDGTPKMIDVEIMDRRRVVVETVQEVQDIRYPRTWHRWPEDRKLSIGLVQVERGDPPAGYHPRYYTLSDGATVDGVIEQVMAPRDLEDIRQGLLAEVTAKIDYYRYQAEIEIPDGEGGSIIMPAGERSLGLLSLGRGKNVQGSIKMPIGKRNYRVTQAQIDAIDGILFQHHLDVGTRGVDLREAIEAAVTFEDFLAIDIDAVWPAVFTPEPESTPA